MGLFGIVTKKDRIENNTLLTLAELRIIKEKIMGAREDIQAVTAQLGKVRDEVVAKIAELEQAIVDGSITVEDLAPLKGVAQALDDIVPDAPAE